MDAPRILSEGNRRIKYPTINKDSRIILAIRTVGTSIDGEI